MSKKKILIINPIAPFPKTMASQDRVFRMAKRLAENHHVVLAAFVKNENETKLSNKELEKINCQFIPIKKKNSDYHIINRVVSRMIYVVKHKLFYVPANYFYYSFKSYAERINEIVVQEKFDIVQVEYWYMQQVLRKIPAHIYKVIDTHDVLFEKRNQELIQAASLHSSKEVDIYKKLEIESLKKVNLIISITQKDFKSFRTFVPKIANIIIPTGQDIDYFSNYNSQPINNRILFYGSMGSSANVKAFFRFYEEILPGVKKEIPDIETYIVGANPPPNIISLNGKNGVVVKGYIEDVREIISTFWVMILPLDIAAGFRSRIVEVMALGVPVIGTHKALDNLEMIQGEHGFISDNNTTLIQKLVTILNDKALRNSMSEKCRKFVQSKYSIEKSYGILADYYSNLSLTQPVQSCN